MSDIREMLSKMNEDSISDKMSNQARAGTWINQHHVDSTIGHDERTRQYYKNASNASDSMEAEYWLARVFNDHRVAKNIAQKIYSKEISSATSSMGDIDSLFDDMDPYKSNSFRVRLNDRTRSPEDISGDNQVVEMLYDALAKKWPNKPQAQMVLTYILLRGNVCQNIKFKVPYFDRVVKVCNQIEKDGLNWLTSGNFYNYLNISKTLYYTIVHYLNTYVKKLV